MADPFSDEALGAVTSPKLNLAMEDLTSIPEAVCIARGPHVTELNLSENDLTDLSFLGHFSAVETLILDKNASLGSLAAAGCPSLPTVRTLWFNNNAVEDFTVFMDEAVERFPNLRRLAAMRNPASPSLVCLSQEDVEAARRHRLYVLFRQPLLEFLDAQPVSQEERDEAREKGQYFAVRRRAPDPIEPAAAGGGDAGDGASTAPAAPAASPSVSSQPPPAGSDAREMAAFPSLDPSAAAPATGARQTRNSAYAIVGRGQPSYDGRNSEGNRFITDDDL